MSNNCPPSNTNTATTTTTSHSVKRQKLHNHNNNNHHNHRHHRHHRHIYRKQEGGCWSRLSACWRDYFTFVVNDDWEDDIFWCLFTPGRRRYWPRGGGRTARRKFTLRRQLFGNFGIAALLSLVLVVLSSCLAIRRSGRDVKYHSNLLMREQVRASLVESSRLVVESYVSRLADVEETVQIVVETIRDRIVGYPSLEGWQDGRYVPFRDAYTGSNVYPLARPPVPLEPRVVLQDEGPDEFSDPRIEGYPHLLYSARTASYHDATLNALALLSNGNETLDVENDGIYQATGDLATFLRPLYEADPELLRLRITFVHYHSTEEGKGGTVLQYPAGKIATSYVSKGCDWLVQRRNPLTERPYGTLGQVSTCHVEGTDISTTEQAATEYNALEDGTAEWLIDAMDEEMTTTLGKSDVVNRVFWKGPTVACDNQTDILTAGKAVFDRLTGELIGFVTADLLEEKLKRELDTSILEQPADVYVVKYKDGIVISQSLEADYELRTVLPQFEEIKEFFNFQPADDETVDFWTRYDQERADRLRAKLLEDPYYGTDHYGKKNSTNGISSSNGRRRRIKKEEFVYFDELESGGLLTASPLPLPPHPDDPNREDYVPLAFVVQVISQDVFSIVQDIEESIDRDVRKNITWSVVAGFLGLVVVLTLLSFMSRVLTRPLTWITDVSRQIIYSDYARNNSLRSKDRHHDNGDAQLDHSSEESHGDDKVDHDDHVEDKKAKAVQNMEEDPLEFRSEQLLVQDKQDSGDDRDEENAMTDLERDEHQKMNDEEPEEDEGACSESHAGNLDYYESKAALSQFCAPRTEIKQLVEEFQVMIHGFSGGGPSQVAEAALLQLKNTLTWHDDFAKLYDREGLTRKAFRQTSQSTEATETELTDASQQSIPCPPPMDVALFQRQNEPSNRQLLPHQGSSYLAIAIQEEQQPEFTSQPIRELPTETDESDHARTEIEVVESAQGGLDDSGDSSLGQVEEPTPTQALNEQLDMDIDDSIVDDSESLTDEEGPKKQPPLEPRKRRATVSFLPPPPPYGAASGKTTRGKIHRHPVLGAPKSSVKPILEEDGAVERAKVCCSTLFWSIVFLMALPVLLTSLAVTGIASSSIGRSLPEWIGGAEEASNKIESDTLQLIANRKANVLSTLTHGPVRDLHFMSRIANWLFFGGVERGPTFTEMQSAANDCKSVFGSGGSKIDCPAYLALPCSCDWKDWRENKELDPSCTSDFEVQDSRYLQIQDFVVQSLDADPLTGNRYSSPSYPRLSYSPDTTEWFSNISAVPGAEKGPAAAGGYGTLYDRLAVTSATATYNLPMYNYGTSLDRQKHYLAGYVSFEDDGGLHGWTGCHYGHTERSSFVSSIENGAAVVNEDLCPLGKYGYDARCRSWYATGRDSYLKDQVPVHLPAPYLFASGSKIASSLTSPIANPKTGEYVGQVLLDYLPQDITSSIELLEESLTFLITPDEDVLGGDTVVGPSLGKKDKDGWKSAPIGDLLFSDERDSANRNYFEKKILSLMKDGLSGLEEFNWTNPEGVLDLMCLAFSPVSIRVMLPMASDDFAAGVKASESFIYSVGVGIPCSDISKPFLKVEDDLDSDLQSNQNTYVAVNVTATALFIIFSTIAAAYISRPMIKLLNIVRTTNNGEPVDSIPPLNGGCKEIQDVYSTFAKLNKIVRVSNNSFFSGNLDMAHHFVSDALTLFRHVDDQKAIAVACNNLANTLFAIQHDQRLEQVPEQRQVDQVLALYDEAVERGHKDFTKVPEEDDLKVRYALQLSDRVFNRGLYYFFLGDIDRGTQDIAFARNLYYDIREILLAKKQLFATADEYFSRLLRRISSLASCLQGFDGLRDLWDPETLLDEADQMVAAAWRAPSCPLFREVQRTGRRQQLESSAILLAVHSECDDPLHAAKLGMRMLVEDLFVLEPAFVRAAEALLQAMEDGEVDGLFSADTMECASHELKCMLDSCRYQTDFINFLTMEKF